MPGPAGDHLGDGLRVDARPAAAAIALELRSASVLDCELGLHGDQSTWAGTTAVAVSAAWLRFLVARPRSSGQAADLFDAVLLVFPPCLQGEPVGPASSSSRWTSATRSACSAAGGPFAVEDAQLDLEVVDPAAAVLDGRGDRVLADGNAGAGGIEQADATCPGAAGRDVAVRKLDGALDGLVEDAHAVVLFQRRR